jgi:hypothetical protein
MIKKNIIKLKMELLEKKDILNLSNDPFIRSIMAPKGRRIHCH